VRECDLVARTLRVLKGQAAAPIAAPDDSPAMRLKRGKRGFTFDDSRVGTNESKTANTRHNVRRLPKCRQRAPLLALK